MGYVTQLKVLYIAERYEWFVPLYGGKLNQRMKRE